MDTGQIQAQDNSLPNLREDLIHLLIGSTEAAARVCERLDRGNAWPAMFDLAARWSVIPNLRQRLVNLGTPLSADLKRRLFVLFQEVYVSSLLQARRGVSLCRKLEEKGFPVVIFKGLASIAHLYQGKPSARTIKDVDILLREKDLDDALSFMESLGLKADHGGDLKGYAAFVRNSPGFAGNEALSAGDSGQGELDVHWSLGPRTAPEFQVEAIIDRSGWVSLFENQVRVISPVDGLLLTAHHAVREDFAPDGMLRDVLDASAWLNLLEQRGEREESLELARRCRIEDPVLALAQILAPKDDTVSQSHSSAPRAAGLAQLFWLQARNGRLGKDLTYLADPYSVWQILRGALSGWGGYAARMKAFEVKLTGQPVPLGRRAAYLGRHLAHHGFSGWRMIRLLAKTKAAYQRGA